jgi:uncharacterized membrane protein YdbT with pleckstrin-like domain
MLELDCMEPIQKVEFIRHIHLFTGLSEEDLNLIAEKMAERICAPEEVIFRQGQVGEQFYILFSGALVAARTTRRLPQPQITDLVVGDFFGEEALRTDAHRRATVTAENESVLLSLSRADYHELLKKIPGLRSTFEVTFASRRLASRLHFSWLEPDEVIYFVTQKHPVILVRSLVVPILALLVPVILFVMFLLFPATKGYLLVGGLSLLLIGVWIFLKWLDWGNDYYIVTNRRVVFVEKIILLYDSRQEAPLTTILSVNTQTDVVGRTFGFGDVIVRTYVGNIVFKNIGFPEIVQALLRQYWDRTKKSSRVANVEAMKLSIRQKLGLAPVTPTPPPPKPATKPAVKFNLFKVRFEELGIITYRKHWFVLFKQTLLPGILALSVLGFIIWDFFKNGVFGRDTSLLLSFFFFAFVPLALWWLYQTIDWSNDQFQVTEDQILDIDRTPLGRVTKNVAPLDNILNMEARREGLFQVLFNYGNVYITVGTSQMVFENVRNPDDVQQDIDQRRVARHEKQERERATAERERLSEFFAAYHQNATAFQEEIEEKKRHPQSDSPPGEGVAEEEN